MSWEKKYPDAEELWMKLHQKYFKYAVHRTIRTVGGI